MVRRPEVDPGGSVATSKLARPGFRATLCVASLTLTSVAPAASTDPAPGSEGEGWRWLGTAYDTRGGVSPGGNLWLERSDLSVTVYSLDEVRFPCGGSDASGKRTLQPPPGYRVHRLACGPDGRVWVLASRRLRSYDRLFVLDPSASEWREIDVGNLGSLFALDIDPGGVVWVGGVRHEVFRIESDRATRESTPLPYHNETIRMLGDDSGWIAAGTLDRWALYRRSPGHGWETVARERGVDRLGIARATDDAVWVIGQRDLTRYDRSGASPPETSPVWAHDPGALVHMSDESNGWSIRDGRLRRIEAGRARPIGVPLPFAPRTLVGTMGGRPIVLDAEGRLWEPSDLATPGELPGYDRLVLADGPGLLLRGFGAAVFGSGPDAWVYLIDHESPNPTIRAGDVWISRSLRDWRRLSTTLGNGDVGRSSTTWNFTYDLAAAVADLNGDGLEDLVLTTLYDGVKLYRNVAGTHFVDYTAPSGLGRYRGDLDHATCLLDVDLDGDLDVYVARFLGSDGLLLNNGAGVFEDATVSAGVTTQDSSTTPTCVDLDGDGDTDVVVPTWGRGLRIRENVSESGGRPRFRTHVWSPAGGGAPADPGLTPLNLNAAAPADLDGDGLPELFVTAQPGRDLLLRNRGALTFEVDPGVLPLDEPGVASVGGSFLDFDHDGDLDLIVTGRGGARLYRNDDGRFSWTPPVDWDDRLESGRPGSTGLAILDGDDDGDLDLVVTGDEDATRFYRCTTDDDRWIQVRVVGPPANRSAIGATVSLRRVDGDHDAAVATRTVPGSTGYGSHDSKVVHFGGVRPGRRYRVDANISGPNGATASVEAVAPARVTVRLDGAAPPGRSWAAWPYRLRTFPGDPWNRRWIALALLVAATTGLLAVLTSRRTEAAVWTAAIVAAQVALMTVLYVGLPVDPGAGRLAASIGPAVLLAGLGLLAVRSRVDPRAVPELLVELDVTLRTFRHNQTPHRALERLRFVARNLLDAGQPPSGARLHLLREDLHRFREIVAPEIGSMVRLARALGLDADRGATVARRLRSVSDELLRIPEPTPGTRDVRTAVNRIRALADVLDDFDRWRSGLREETTRRLSLDLGGSLKEYVASRRTVVPRPLELHDRIGRPLRVRFLDADLHRALDSVVENSVAAMNGVGEGRISVEADWDGGRRAAIRVVDDGPGIPDGHRDLVFRPGWSTRGPGHGYGLHYVRRVVQRFGGEVGIETVARGGCVRIELDVVSAAPGRMDG